MDLEERIMELSRYGYACGQILAILLLDTIGEENPALVRCMQGLNGGIGSSGDVCGCMAAGCCLISYFTGKPADDEFDSPHHKTPQGTYMMFLDCTEWCEKHNVSIDELQRRGIKVGVVWQDGRPFHGPCHIRINLALPKPRLEEALHRMKEYVFV